MTRRVAGLRCDGWRPKKNWNITWWWQRVILWYGGDGTNFQKSGNDGCSERGAVIQD